MGQNVSTKIQSPDHNDSVTLEFVCINTQIFPHESLKHFGTFEFPAFFLSLYVTLRETDFVTFYLAKNIVSCVHWNFVLSWIDILEVGRSESVWTGIEPGALMLHWASIVGTWINVC